MTIFRKIRWKLTRVSRFSVLILKVGLALIFAQLVVLTAVVRGMLSYDVALALDFGMQGMTVVASLLCVIIGGAAVTDLAQRRKR